MLKTIILILLCILAVWCLLKIEVDIFKLLFGLSIIGIVVLLCL
jgi:hypothetical protein